MTRYPQGVLVSCEIPWDEREQLLEQLFRREIRFFLSQGFQHIYIFGTAGEGYAVDTCQFREIASIFREETSAPDVLPQVGVIALSTRQVRERIDIAYDLGFRTFQISLPSWSALTDQELHRFFRDVCLPYPEANFLHYNLMRSKRLLLAADYRALVDTIPNLVATKNTSPDLAHTAALLRVVPELQHFLGEATFVNGCAASECSLLSSFAPLFPCASQKLFQLASSGAYTEALQFQRDYLRAAMDVIGPLLRVSHVDGAYDKAVVRLGGLDMPLRLLSPYSGVDEEAYAEAQHILREQYGEWK